MPLHRQYVCGGSKGNEGMADMGVCLSELGQCAGTACMHSWLTELEWSNTSYSAVLRIARQSRVDRDSISGETPIHSGVF
jgi:hypothetical protein